MYCKLRGGRVTLQHGGMGRYIRDFEDRILAMNLTLEVISANGSSLGAGRRKVFGAEGGRIGRAPDCDWVLLSPDRYISRHHATILYQHGQFYVKAEGENGVAINTPNTLLPINEPHLINQGDRLYIDEYEILVSVPQEARSPR